MTLLRGLGVAGADRAGTHRRVGVQARADGARQAAARRVHAARSPRMTQHIVERRRRNTRATRFPATTRRSKRRARNAAARCRRTTRSSSARTCDFSILEDPGRPPVRDCRKSRRCCASETIGPLDGLPQQAWAGRSRRCSSSRDDERESSNSISATGRRRRRRRGARFQRPEAARRVPEVRRARVRARRMNYVCEKAVGAGRRPAISARAR